MGGKRAGLATFVVVLTGVLATLVPAAHARPECTYTGGPGPDFAPVTDGRDVLCTGGGDDVVDPSPGDDVIFSGGGRDLVNGGPGDDVVHGGGGGDLLEGEGGRDRIDGGAGGDTLRGGSGLDRLWGDRGADVLAGGDDSAPDRLRGGAGADTATRQPGDVVASAALGGTLCKSEWTPCYTTANETAESQYPSQAATFEVIDRDSCGGSNEPETISPNANQQWNCGGFTGNFTYFDPVSGDQLTVDTYLPQWGPFKDPYVTCEAPNWQNLGAGTAPPEHTCAPFYTGNGEWPAATVTLALFDNSSGGLGMGQICEPVPGVSICDQIGEMLASNSGSVSILNNGPGAVHLYVDYALSQVDLGVAAPGQTVTTDIDTYGSILADRVDSSQSTQILITRVVSWGHDSVDALMGR
jgi:hypothetical protein